MRLGLRAALAALAVLLVHASSASAQWLAPVTLSPAGLDTNQSSVAMAPSGDAAAAWSQTVAGGSIRPVWASSRPAGGAWTAPSRLAPDSITTNVTMDAQGNAIAVWNDDLGIVTASLPAGRASWSAPERVVTDSATHFARVLVSPSGAAVLSYYNGAYGSPHSLMAAVRMGPAAAWTTPQPITGIPAGAEFGRYDVGIDDAGSAVAVWCVFDPSSQQAQPLLTSTRPASGGWSPPQAIGAAGAKASNSTLAVSRGGDALVSWQEGLVIHARYRGSSTGWGPDVAFLGNGSGPQIALDDHGGGTVVWTAESQSGQTVIAVEHTRAGTWSAPAAISPTSATQVNAQLASNAGGDTLVVWNANIDSTYNYVIHAAMRSGPQGGWRSAQTLSAPGVQSSRARVAIDADGDGLVIWQRGPELQVAGYDAAGPQLRGLDIPSTATTGQAVSFSVSPLDVWSTPTATQWSFGDGGTASGTSAAHAFAAPGAYTAAVSSFDVFGRQTSASQTITVAQAAAAPPQSDARTTLAQGGVAKGSILSPVTHSWRVKGTRLTLTRLQVRNAPTGATATLTCKGKHCPLKSLRVAKRTHGGLDILKALKRKRIFHAGQTLEVRVTAPELNGKLVRLRLRAGKVPNSSTFCVPLGTSKAVRSCS